MRLSILLLLAALSPLSCDDSQPESASGVTKATVRVATGADGLTTEQHNVGERLKQDNTPGALKHLYVLSAYSGQVLIYSTVRGKVTSSGKRLSPSTISGTPGIHATCSSGFQIEIGGDARCTQEVLQDDGTYGSSMEYLFWWDTRGIYHQHYVQGGQIVHVSSEPLSVKSVVLNLELAGETEATRPAPAVPSASAR